MRSLLFFLIAAVGEISGCYTFWVFLRQGKSIFWLIPGILALTIFATALTKVQADYAGRVYAAYGGIYILASLTWLWLIEGIKPDKCDLLGVSLALLGTMVVLLGRHRT